MHDRAHVLERENAMLKEEVLILRTHPDSAPHPAALQVPELTLALRRLSDKLTLTEEYTIVQYILDLDSRGFSPRLCEVADMADKLLSVRGGESVGKHWAERFVSRSDELKTVFNRAKDRQRILQEDPQVISAWFQLVADTKAVDRSRKYGGI